MRPARRRPPGTRPRCRRDGGRAARGIPVDDAPGGRSDRPRTGPEDPLDGSWTGPRPSCKRLRDQSRPAPRRRSWPRGSAADVLPLPDALTNASRPGRAGLALSSASRRRPCRGWRCRRGPCRGSHRVSKLLYASRRVSVHQRDRKARPRWRALVTFGGGMIDGVVRRLSPRVGREVPGSPSARTAPSTRLARMVGRAAVAATAAECSRPTSK